MVVAVVVVVVVVEVVVVEVVADLFFRTFQSGQTVLIILSGTTDAHDGSDF